MTATGIDFSTVVLFSFLNTNCLEMDQIVRIQAAGLFSTNLMVDGNHIYNILCVLFVNIKHT